jgi:hypothetical protein
MATKKQGGYWFPRRWLHTGHFPVWVWLFPPFWLLLVPIYACWLVALAIWLVISIPVNLVLLFTRRQPKARYDVYTGKRLS